MGKKLAENPIIVLIGLVAGIIAIYSFVTGNQNIQQVIVTNTPFPVIAETPIPQFSKAIETVNSFFTWINDAQTKEDLLNAWNIESTEFQCSEPAGCDPTGFQNFWIDWKVRYKLYDCGSNIIATEQIYYPRDPFSNSKPTDVLYRKYKLAEEDGQLKIITGENIPDPSGTCPLVISVP